MMEEAVLYTILILLGGLTIYVHQKAKNQASKEDIAEITSEVEQVKIKYNSRLEEIKIELQHKSEATSEKREVYKEVADTMRIFIRGGGVNEKRSTSFMRSYQHIWLWGSDEVVSSLSEFLRELVAISSSEKEQNQNAVKKAYVNCIIAMRKDLGFADTTLENYDYEFVNLVQRPLDKTT